MTAPSFTFDIAVGEPDLVLFKPLFAHILGSNKEKPMIRLTNAGEPIQRGAGVTWLRAQQARYSKSLGDRSILIKSMDLPSKVVLKDVVDETDA